MNPKIKQMLKANAQFVVILEQTGCPVFHTYSNENHWFSIEGFNEAFVQKPERLVMVTWHTPGNHSMLILGSPESITDVAFAARAIWNLDPIDAEAVHDACAEFEKENDWGK
jgi:hypothetical protein